THHYRLAASTGEFLRIEIEQQGMNASLSLAAPDGRVVAEAVVASGAFDTKQLSFIAESDGEYPLSVRSLALSAGGRRFKVQISERRRPLAPDLVRISAERKLAEAESLASQNRAEAIRSAVTKYEEALELWSAAGEREAEAYTLLRIGNLRHNLGEPNKAI